MIPPTTQVHEVHDFCRSGVCESESYNSSSRSCTLPVAHLSMQPAVEMHGTVSGHESLDEGSRGGFILPLWSFAMDMRSG